MNNEPSGFWSLFRAALVIFPSLQERLRVLGSEELAHWAKLFEQFNYSPQEFYALVEKNLEPRKIPGAGGKYRAFHEAGILSADRLYFSVKRERLLFVLCAAPFGTGFFVSSRLLDYRSQANLLHYLAALVLLILVAGGVSQKYGLIPGLFADGLVFTFCWSLCRQAAEEGSDWLDDRLPDVPVIGPIYESLFRPDTYYRRDTAEMFQQAVHNAVMQSVDEMTTQKGIRGLTDEERKPVVRSLYRK